MEKETPDFYQEKDIFGLDKQELADQEVSTLPPGKPELDVTYASLSTRIGAHVLDLLIVGIPLYILESSFLGDDYGSKDVIYYQALFELIVLTLYYALSESSQHQATFGKRICELKVIDDQGHRLTFLRAVARYFAKTISILPLGFGLWAIATDKKRQSWHDALTGCYVIENKSSDE